LLSHSTRGIDEGDIEESPSRMSLKPIPISLANRKSSNKIIPKPSDASDKTSAVESILPMVYVYNTTINKDIDDNEGVDTDNKK
jgi:hypothetical protein